MVNLTELYRKRVLSKALKIGQDPSHCLHTVLEWLQSKKKECVQKDVPQIAIKIHSFQLQSGLSMKTTVIN